MTICPNPGRCLTVCVAEIARDMAIDANRACPAIQSSRLVILVARVGHMEAPSFSRCRDCDPSESPSPRSGEGGAKRRMGCGKQVGDDESSRRRLCNRAGVEAAGHTPSGPSGHLPQQAGEGVTLVIGRQDGRAAAFPPVFAQVRSGAASEHDEGGGHALACGSESSDRRARFSQANADRTLFRGLRLSCAKDRRRSGRPHARDGECEDQGRRERRWFDARISRSSIPDELIIGGLRSLLSGYARRCAKRELAPLPAKSGKGAERRMGCGKQDCDNGVCGGVHARRLPSAAAGHTPSGPSGHLPQQAGEGEGIAERDGFVWSRGARP